MRRSLSVLAALAVLSLGAAPSAAGAQRAVADSVLAAPGDRVRLRAAGAYGWQVGRLAPAGADTVRLLACPSCAAREYRRSAVRQVEWSTGAGRNAGFYGAVVGLPLGAIVGAVAGTVLDRSCASTNNDQLCIKPGTAFGFLGGAIGGAVGGGVVAHRHFGERWHPARLPAAP